MSSSSQPIPASTPSALVDSTAEVGSPPSFLRRIGAWVEQAGEWLNPLLVKEVRQSLKSRRFSITFTAVLCLSWLWSIAGVARLGPSVTFGANGPELFFGYYLILAFPLILMVPYAAFRSLIAEREDNTYELVAITTLKPRQIVAGKLGSSVAQMAVYFSAVAPCLAFTYMLRGIDVPTIVWILFYTFLASLGFSLCALLLASIAKEKHWQVMLAVIIIVVFFWAFYGAVWLCHVRLGSSRLLFTTADFWMQNLLFLTFYGSTFALFYLATAAQLTFTAENRSTPLRRAMLAQQVLLIGWMGFAVFYESDRSRRTPSAELGFIGLLGTMLVTIYWYIMGSFMIGEAPQLSQRVKRRLPQSTFGRALLTCFNPGPGTGYLFAVSNVTAVALIALIAAWISSFATTTTTTGVPTGSQVVADILLLWGYLVFYLGVASLLLRLLRRFTKVNLAAAVLTSFILIMAGWGIPAIIDPYDPQINTYNLGHITDVYWSCLAGIFNPQRAVVYNEDLVYFVLPAAVAVFLANLVYIVPEIRQQRMSAPARVQQEDAALAAAEHPVVPQPQSPWDV